MKRIDGNLFVRISDDESYGYRRFVYTVKCHEHLLIPNRAINKSTSSHCRAEHLTCVVSTLSSRPCNMTRRPQKPAVAQARRDRVE
jgi:hypothetical protein